MKLKVVILALTAGLLFAKPIYDFKNEELEARFYHNISLYRCLVCQNQSLLDSDAALAKDLKSIIYKQVISGQTDQEIHEFLVARYGHFIELNPDINKHSSMLWFLPLLLLLIWAMRSRPWT